MLLLHARDLHQFILDEGSLAENFSTSFTNSLNEGYGVCLDGRRAIIFMAVVIGQIRPDLNEVGTNPGPNQNLD